MPAHSTRFAPIGVFDSGVGGLTVLERLLSEDIPELQGEDFVQVADLANIHYGSYAKTGATSFLRELVIRDVLFLLSDGYFVNSAETRPSGVKTPAKIVVIGCNTAVAYGLEAAKAVIAGMGSAVRLVNIVECGARTAIRKLGTDAEQPSRNNPCLLVTARTIWRITKTNGTFKPETPSNSPTPCPAETGTGLFNFFGSTTIRHIWHWPKTPWCISTTITAKSINTIWI